MDALSAQFKILYQNLAPYKPKINGAVKVTNENVKTILQKIIETYRAWHEKLHLPYLPTDVVQLGNTLTTGL